MADEKAPKSAWKTACKLRIDVLAWFIIGCVYWSKFDDLSNLQPCTATVLRYVLISMFLWGSANVAWKLTMFLALPLVVAMIGYWFIGINVYKKAMHECVDANVIFHDMMGVLKAQLIIQGILIWFAVFIVILLVIILTLVMCGVMHQRDIPFLRDREPVITVTSHGSSSSSYQMQAMSV